MCLCVYYWEKTVPHRATKLKMKILKHLNVCTRVLDFRFFLLVFILLIRNNNFMQLLMGFLQNLMTGIGSVKHSNINYVIEIESEMNWRRLRDENLCICLSVYRHMLKRRGLQFRILVVRCLREILRNRLSDFFQKSI